jgi:hypothetical protein
MLAELLTEGSGGSVEGKGVFHSVSPYGEKRARFKYIMVNMERIF